QLLVDLSHEATNLDRRLGAEGILEENSSRINLTTRRTVDWVGRASEGCIFRWSRGGGDYSEIRIDSSGDLEVTVDGGSTTEVIESDAFTSSNNIVVTWSMEPNPETTGASDARRSEVQILNLTSGVCLIHAWAHEAEAGTDSGTRWFGSREEEDEDRDGLNGDTCCVRLCSGFHSSTATREPWVGLSSRLAFVPSMETPQDT